MFFFEANTTIEASMRRHSMSRYPHLAFQTLKAADLRINASEAGWHMVSARTALASHIGIAIRLRQNSYVDAPAARALQVYGPTIARDHGSKLPRWSDVDQASVSSFAMITLMVGLIVATDETLQLRRANHARRPQRPSRAEETAAR
ncbi:hypothetical protein AAFG07_21100 [Bradyrhizobium sp. B097]|uniref:hypothetical protein n=1 Tax=Bradyrhizobium sp. B097 TaxID=3140244 RepID=UPI003182D73E